MNCRIANAPVSWGVDYAAANDNPRWTRVLDEIAEAGYRWTELGPLGFLPTDPARLKAELDQRHLALCAGFVFDAFHDPAQRQRLADVAHATARIVSALGGTHLVLIDHPVDERTRVAGRPEFGRRLTMQETRALTANLAHAATIARDEYGLRAVLHHHAGTYIEHPDEIERILDAIDPETLGFCVDTGHAAYAGIDPVALYQRHAARTNYLHLKDVNQRVREAAVGAGRDFDAAVASGIFCPLGSGMVNFEQLAATLAERRFDGWATVEQDIDPQSSREALPYATRSLEFLRRAGLTEEPAATGSGPPAA